MTSALPITLQRLAANEQAALDDFVSRLRQNFASSILHVWLFGSKARGDAALDSDLDVLVVVSSGPPNLQAAIDALAVEVNLRHGVVVSDHIVDRKRYRQLREWREPIYSDIQRDGIDLWTLELSLAT